MLKINKIELDFEPRNKIVPHLPDGDKAQELANKLGSHRNFVKANYLNLRIADEISKHSKNV